MRQLKTNFIWNYYPNHQIITDVKPLMKYTNIRDVQKIKTTVTLKTKTKEIQVRELLETNFGLFADEYLRM